MPIKTIIDHIPGYSGPWENIPEYLQDITADPSGGEHQGGSEDANDFRLEDYDKLSDEKERKIIITPGQIVTQMPIGKLRQVLLNGKANDGERALLIRYDGDTKEVDPATYNLVKQRFLPTALYYYCSWKVENTEGNMLLYPDQRINFDKAVLTLPIAVRPYAVTWMEQSSQMHQDGPGIINYHSQPTSGSYDTALAQTEQQSTMVGSNAFGKTD